MGQHEKLQQVEEYNQLLATVLMSLCEELETTPEALLESALEEGILGKIGKAIRRKLSPSRHASDALHTARLRAIAKRTGKTGKDKKDLLIWKHEHSDELRGTGYGSNRKTVERQKENRKLAQKHRHETRAIEIEKQKRDEKKTNLQTTARERMAREQPKNLEHQKKMAKRKQERARKAEAAAATRRKNRDWGYSSSSDSSYSPTSGTM